MAEILVVEDDEGVGRGIAFALEKDGHHVRVCRSAGEASRAFDANYPDFVICDIQLPDGSGLKVVSDIRAHGDAWILCLTACDQEMDQVAGYQAGADDYMTKPFSLSVLVLKVNAYLERSRAGRRGLVSGEIQVSLEDMKVSRSGEEILLTRNEWRLLILFLENARQILSKEQILEHLFDAEGNYVNDNAVAVNVNRLREKIERDRTRPVYIKNIRGLGYVWDCACRSI